MKLLILSALAVACLAEPPVENTYLPPHQGGNSGPPSTSYGPPQRQTDALFSRQQSRRPSNQYIPPSTQYGAPQQQYSAPSTQYGAPQQQYNAPSTQYGAPAQTPDSQYGVPAAPSSQYGAPGFGGSGQAQSRQYLPPGSGYAGNGGDDSNEPNYSFEYMVKDDASGNDFGHRESRKGEKTEGRYYVLLPDGRKQIVTYEADEDGFKPRISYEDTGLGQNGYGRGGQGGYNYDNQGGPY